MPYHIPIFSTVQWEGSPMEACTRLVPQREWSTEECWRVIAGAQDVI